MTAHPAHHPAELGSDSADAAAALLRESFEARLHPYVPYCQPEVGQYLATVVDHPRGFADRHLYGARSPGGQLTAFAEFRAVGANSDLLSYICVAPEARGQGLAQRMLQEHLHASPHVRELVLDVFAHNEPARGLYRRLGFEEVSRTTWWSRDLPAAAPGTSGRLRVHDWHLSVAALHRYGFCMIDAEWSGRRLTLGVPGRSVVRVPDEIAFRDQRLLSEVRALLPTLERALLISPSAPEDRTDCARVVDSWRLRAPVPTGSLP
ncbi:GNAT family N-acetyltransferase [Blastococcus sp. SYSU DS0552]